METQGTLKKKVKRSFSEAWLNDERFKSWLQKVPSDDSLFHCTICTKNFMCGPVSNIIRHAESAQHKTNISLHGNNVIRKSLRPFMQQWLEIDELKPWLREVENDANLFSCMICDKTFSVGLSHIYRHAES